MHTDKEQKLLPGHYEKPRVKKVEGQVWREGPCPLSELSNQHRAAVTGRLATARILLYKSGGHS